MGVVITFFYGLGVGGAYLVVSVEVSSLPSSYQISGLWVPRLRPVRLGLQLLRAIYVQH